MKNKMSFFITLALLVVYSLFTIKYQARQKNKILITLNQNIKEEEKKIQLLETDLAHRARPQVIRQMLFLLSNLKPTEPEQIIRIPPS